MDESDKVCYKLLSKIQDTHLKWRRSVLVIYYLFHEEVPNIKHFSKYGRDGDYQFVFLSL